MTAAAIVGTIPFPNYPYSSDSTDSATTLDGAGSPDTGVAGDYHAWVLKAPATGTIDKVHVRIATTAVTGGNATLSCRIFSVDSAGDPDDDAVYGTCAQSDYSVTGTDDNTYVTFSALACSATKGDVICVTVWLSALVTTASVGLVYRGSTFGNSQQYPYQTTRTTGTGAGSHANTGGGFTLEYSGSVFYDIGLAPAAVVYTEDLDADGSIRRSGNRFVTPVPVTVDGFWVLIDNDNDTTTLDLYDTDGTSVLATASHLTAQRVNTNGGLLFLPFNGAAVNLTANTANPYRVVATTNNTAATGCRVRGLSVGTAAHLAMLGLGTNCYHTSHNGTSWTDTTTKRASIGLLASKFDDGAGTGGTTIAGTPMRRGMV